MTRGDTRDGDVAWCYDAVTDVSRTFAITVAELDEPVSREICVGYLVCRIADTIEDDARLPPEAKSRLLREYDRAIDPTTGADGSDFRAAAREWVPDDPGPDWAVVEQTTRVLGVFRSLEPDARECIRPPVRELVGGMAEFVDRYADEGGLRIRTIEELEEYCGYVAGTVGELVTNLVAREASPAVVDRLESNARAFGLLLQLVNVPKDVRTDYIQENNVYIPRTWLHEAGLTVSDIGDADAADRMAPVVKRVTARAETYLDDAQAWLEAMPENRGNTLSAWAIPFLLAVGTIRELNERPADPIREGDVKVTRHEVQAIMDRFDDGVTGEDIARLRDRIRRRPLHEW